MCVCGGCRTICGWELNIVSEGMHMLSTRHGITQLMLKATQGLPWWSKWLKLHTPNPGAPGLIPGWGTRFHKLQLKHGTTKQMFFKNNTKIQLCVPFSSCVPERRWRTWYLSIFQKWGCEDGRTQGLEVTFEWNTWLTSVVFYVGHTVETPEYFLNPHTQTIPKSVK